MTKKFLIPFFALAFWVSTAFATVPIATITGTVLDGAGDPVANGVITFNTLLNQVVNSNLIAQTLKSTTTDENGDLVPISLAQGLYVQVTINGGAPTMAIVPFTTSLTFETLLSNTFPNPASSLTTLTLTGTTAPPCQSGAAVLYFDSGTNKLMFSENCGSFAHVAAISGATNTGHLAAFNSSGQLVDSGSNLATEIVLMGGSGTTLPTGSATSRYMPVYGLGLSSTAEDVKLDTGNPGTVSNLFCSGGGGTLGGSGAVFTFFKNSTPTSLTCTMSATDTECTDTTHTVSLVQSDRISFKIDLNSITGTARGRCSAVFVPDPS
jgi:hypothetical protein